MTFDPSSNSPAGMSLIELSGLDLRNGSISAPRGSCREMLNFEIDQQGGLVRASGWQKYDGTVMGPALDQAVVFKFNVGSITGVFLYGELISVSSSGLPQQTLTCLGTANIATSGFGLYMAAAYPVGNYTNWFDPTSFGTLTTIVGLTSGATISSLIAPGAMLLTDPSISTTIYNGIKMGIVAKHAATVSSVPGMASSPIDCEFSFNNNSYAIHDCVFFNFNTGNTPTLVTGPLEGHYIRNSSAGGITIGRLLQVNIDNAGSFDKGTASGWLIVYDVLLGLPLPSAGDNLDLYDAKNAVLVQASAMKATGIVPNNRSTRALLYQTSEQQVKTQGGNPPPGKYMTRPPSQQGVPRTWSRPQLTREISYTQKYQGGTAGIGFGPTGANDFSTYEYDRQGLTQQLQALAPVTAAEKFPTAANAAATNPPTAGAWANITNIFADDAAVASCVGAAYYLRGSAFDFSFIPPGSRILGVSCRVKCDASAVGQNPFIQMVALTIPDPNGPNGQGWRICTSPLTWSVPTGAINTLTIAPLTNFVFGSTTSLWGEQLTLQTLQDPNFGLYVSIGRTPGGVPPTYNVDCFTLTVTYVPPSRTVYVRNVGAAAPADIPVNIIHYSIDNGSFSDVNNPAVGVLTFWVQQTAAGATATEADATNAGMARVIGPGEQIRDGPAGAGNLLGYTNGSHTPVTFPGGAMLDQFQSRYEVIDANFYDDVNARAGFIVNGVEWGTMFDTVYTIHIRTGRPTDQDNPRYVANHLGYLHLGFASGAVVNCGTGRPLSVIGAPGSNTYNFGEPVTGILTLNGQTLGVWTDRCTRGLQGASPSPDLGGYTTIIISPAIGAIEHSVRSVVGEAVWTSYRGFETVNTVNTYGDFETLPASDKISAWLQPRLQVDRLIATTPSRFLYAYACRNKRQYVACFEDGYFAKMTMFGQQKEPEFSTGVLGRPMSAATFPDYGVQTYLRAVIRHVSQGVRTDGKEIILASFENLSPLFGSTAFYPYVVQLECGDTWDISLNLPCWFDLNALYFNQPQQQGKYQSLTIFVNALEGTQLRTYTMTNFDGPMTPNPNPASDPNVNPSQLTVPRFGADGRAYIPPPQVGMVMDIPATGRMLRLRVDACQDVDSNVSICPVRVTHLGFQEEPERVDKS
jgi:hypothetical protein